MTSRAADDDLIGDDQDTRASDVMALPRPSVSTPTAAKSAPAQTAPADDALSDGTAGGGLSANGAPASGNGIDGTRDVSANGGKDASAIGGPAVATARDTARASDVDATIADGVPALPADTIGSSRGTQPKGPDPDGETPGGQADEQSGADTAPPFSFDPSSSVPSAQAEPSSLSPAAFAWETPDPPPDSRSSPARTFLRSGSTAKDPAAPEAASSANPGQTAADKTVAGEGPVTVRSAPRKEQSKQSKRSKRSARQAHLTIARVEPWSVMKFSFVVSLVAFVILFVAVSVLYATLSGLGVFDSLQRVVTSVTSSQGSAGVNAKAWFTASKVLGYTALLGSLNIVLITAMATIGSVVYNLTSRLVGGVEVTLRETE
ncbi:MAG: DUF3566 domain-containing protein [Streptosporangiaceae bacterium]